MVPAQWSDSLLEWKTGLPWMWVSAFVSEGKEHQAWWLEFLSDFKAHAIPISFYFYFIVFFCLWVMYSLLPDQLQLCGSQLSLTVTFFSLCTKWGQRRKWSTILYIKLDNYKQTYLSSRRRKKNPALLLEHFQAIKHCYGSRPVIVSFIFKELWMFPLSVQTNIHMPLFLPEIHTAFIFNGFIFTAFSIIIQLVHWKIKDIFKSFFFSGNIRVIRVMSFDFD